MLGVPGDISVYPGDVRCTQGNARCTQGYARCNQRYVRCTQWNVSCAQGYGYAMFNKGARGMLGVLRGLLIVRCTHYSGVC